MHIAAPVPGMPPGCRIAGATTAIRQPCAAIIASSSAGITAQRESIFFTCQCGTNVAAPRGGDLVRRRRGAHRPAVAAEN